MSLTEETIDIPLPEECNINSINQLTDYGVNNDCESEHTTTSAVIKHDHNDSNDSNDAVIASTETTTTTTATNTAVASQSMVENGMVLTPEQSYHSYYSYYAYHNMPQMMPQYHYYVPVVPPVVPIIPTIHPQTQTQPNTAKQSATNAKGDANNDEYVDDEEDDDEDEDSDPTVAKKPSTKASNVLPIHCNDKMNLNPLIYTNIQQSPYFKNNLFQLKTYHEVIDEIFYNVKHLEPWEKGSRKIGGQTGMCGSVRGVGAGGIISTPFCILFKLFTLKLTRKQVNGLIRHRDSPYIRALGFMYIRFTQPPQHMWQWFEPFLEDEEEVDPKAGGGQTMTIGQLARHMLTKLDWFSTLFPRVPVPIQKDIESKLKARDAEMEQQMRNERGIEDGEVEEEEEEEPKDNRRHKRDNRRSNSKERRRSRERKRSHSRDKRSRSQEKRSRSNDRNRSNKRSRSRSHSHSPHSHRYSRGDYRERERDHHRYRHRY